MANAPHETDCQTSRRHGDALLPIDPWRSLHVHYGMLLGVDDFKTVDAYHRGKMWLHTAWLHREGIVWGFGAELVEGQLVVHRGLAVDAAGRELHLERDACLDLALWFETVADEIEEQPPDPELPEGAVEVQAHVRARFVGCLTRQVPALVEPCDGAGRTTAYSRVFESIEIELVLGLPEDQPAPYHRVRLLFGLDEPILDEGGEPIESDAEVLDALEELAALPPSERPSALEAAMRRFAALDVAELAPAESEDGGAEGGTGLLPAIDPVWVEIATLHDLVLRPDGEHWSLESVTVALDDRPSHVATRSLQDLIAAGLSSSVPAVHGPQLRRETFAFDGTNVISFSTSAELHAATLDDAVAVEWFNGTTWIDWNLDSSAVSGTEVMLKLASLGAPPSVGDVLRFRVRGTGTSPALGVDGWPLAGATDEPPPPPHHGRDFVHMHTIGS